MCHKYGFELHRFLVKTGAYSDQRDLRPPREKSRTPKKSSRPDKSDRDRDGRGDHGKNRQGPSKRTEKPREDKPYRNISSEYRSPKKDTVVRPSVQHYSDDGESVESFGEFRSPKTQVNPRR